MFVLICSGCTYVLLSLRCLPITVQHFQAFTEVMSIIWKRLNDSGKNWRHVYKSLVLLDFLIKCGNDKVWFQRFFLQIFSDTVFVISEMTQFWFGGIKWCFATLALHCLYSIPGLLYGVRGARTVSTESAMGKQKMSSLCIWPS